MADWRHACGSQTVAMESRGVYWLPLFHILESRGLEVGVVNSRPVKNVPGRKSDVAACQWRHYWHAVGRRRASLRPPQPVCAGRALLRPPDPLVTYAAAHIQPRHKALTQMKLQLQHVLRDLTGKTGLAILAALRAGARAPHKRAELRDFRLKAAAETLAKALVGDWRAAPLFPLRQALSAYRHYQPLLAECDQESERLRAQCASQIDPPPAPLPPATPSHRQPQRNASRCQPTDRRPELSRLLGVDLTQGPGLQTPTLQTLFTELGPELSAFPTAKPCASWLGLCPDNRVSGGRVRSAKTRQGKNRAAPALRLAAHSLPQSHSACGDF